MHRQTFQVILAATRTSPSTSAGHVDVTVHISRRRVSFPTSHSRPVLRADAHRQLGGSCPGARSACACWVSLDPDDEDSPDYGR